MGKALMTSDNQKYPTPKRIVEVCADRFAGGHFDLDPCAEDDSHKASHYYTPVEDGLAGACWLPSYVLSLARISEEYGPSISSVDQPIAVWMNPPFADVEIWVARAFWYMREYPHAFRVIVMIVPTRVNQPYYKKLRRCAYMPPMPAKRISYGDETGSPPFDSEIAVLWPALRF